MRVHVTSRGTRTGVPRAVVVRAARAAMRTIRCASGAEVEVAFVTDPVIAQLNRRFLRHRGATDVITFQGSGLPGDRSIGEIVISADRARAQARRAGWRLRDEVATLVVHGVLHLGGYDDHAAGDAARMRTAQSGVVAALRRRRGP